MTGQPNTTGASHQRDPFRWLYRDGLALLPPVDYRAMVAIYDASDVLQSAVTAMEVNVAGFGFQLVPVREIPEERREEAEAEKRRIEAFFRFASEDPWTLLRRKTQIDKEVMGDGYWEVLRSVKGEIIGIEHARTLWMRKGPTDLRPTEVKQWRRNPDSGEWERVPAMRRFRRFVQVVHGVYTWFKEFGDPRKISAVDGRVHDELPDGHPDLATEILNFTLYAPDSPYGKPRWRGAVTDVTGRTAAGEINCDTFDNKAVPPWLICVQGALLGDGVVQQVKEHFAGLRGRENYHAPLILEAAPTSDSITGDGPVPRVKIDVTEMQSKSDALFSKYRTEAAQNTRAAFRLPPLFFGASTDYNRATAEAAQEVGEEQVFAPERALEDEIINRRLMPELGARWWEVKGSSAPLLSEDTLIKLLEVGIKAGALSPEQVARVIDPILAQDITRSETWAKLPTVVIEALLKAGWTLSEKETEGLVAPKSAEKGVGAAVGGAPGAAGAGTGGAAVPADGSATPATAPSAPAEGGESASGQSDASKPQDGQQDTSGRTMLRTLTRAERQSGVMLALVPPEGMADALVLRLPENLEGEVPPEELHVTLAYFGSRDELTDAQLDRIRAVASFAALTRGPIDGQFNGVARFAGASAEDGDAVVLTLDAPGLETWREMLAGALRAASVGPSATHGFVPHMTVCYLAAGAETPMDRIEPAAVQFGSLELWVAGEREKWVLAGG